MTDHAQTMLEQASDEGIKKILLIAEYVCWFDWSGDNNDADAIHAIDQLRIALAALSPASANEDLAP